MPDHAVQQLIQYLTEAHAMEKQAIQLLSKAESIAGDDDIAAIYRAHHLQTQEHERYIAERLAAYDAKPSKAADIAFQVGAVGIGLVAQAAPDTPVRLATTAFAFEHLEIAVYRLIARLARRAGDADTAAVAERILEQEEAAAELVEGTFDRVLEVTLGEPAVSPVTPVTPLGKPSARSDVGHQGPQEHRAVSPDEPIGQPQHVYTPADPDHMSNPDPGHPVDETTPYLPATKHTT